MTSRPDSNGARPSPASHGARHRIAAVEAVVLRAAVDPPWRISTATMSEMYVTLVSVELDNGAKGWGECLGRGAPTATKAIVDELLSPVVVGADAWRTEALWDDMYATMRYRGHSRGFLLEAIAGIDIAVWDALGRSEGQPISRLLHGRDRERVPCYASSVLLHDGPAVVDEAESLVERGYRAIKLKLGRGPVEDARIVAQVRAAVGPEVELMLDANSYLRLDEAVRLMRLIEPLDVAWLEEPLPPDDLDGYRRLARTGLDVPIAAGEGEFTTASVRPLLAERLVAVIQPDVARAGGITGFGRIAALAQAHDVPVAPHVGASGGVCIAASLQVAAAIGGLRTYEHMYVEHPLQELFTTPLPVSDGGTIEVPGGPGLGLEIDGETVRRFAAEPAGATAARV